MSKTVKGYLVRDYKERLGATSDAMVISIRGVKSKNTEKLRRTLGKKQIKVSVVRNSLARRAFAGTPLEQLGPLLTGSNALAYGGQSVIEVAREIVALVAAMPELELKGAILDGTLFEGKKGVEELSKYPTREEAIGKAVTLIVSPGRKLVAQVLGPGSAVVGIIKAIEGKLEKGEAIARKAG